MLRQLIIILALMILPNFAHGKPKSQTLDYGVTVTPIQKDAYIVTDTAFHYSRVLVVKLINGTVFIVSSPFESMGTQSMMSWIRKDLKPDKVIAINTTTISMEPVENDVFHRMGVETWASDLTLKLHRERGSLLRKGAASSFKDLKLKNRVLQTPISSLRTPLPSPKAKLLTKVTKPSWFIFQVMPTLPITWSSISRSAKFCLAAV